MSSDPREERIKTLLLDALDLPAGERDSFVQASECHAAVRDEVLSLIALHERAGDFLEGPTPFSGDCAHESAAGRADDLIGSTIDRYTIHELLGEGGFGRVYLAQQNFPVVRQVALKLSSHRLASSEVLARFEAERQSLARMSHPGIARVLDAGQTPDGRPYFVMDLVMGVPITRFCREHALSIAKRLELFILICSAIQHAHAKGVIHRDIKPSNILVTQEDATPRPIVIDFGIAKAIRDADTGDTTRDNASQVTLSASASLTIGTPEYMSPEQAGGRDGSATDIDTRSDVYALGVLLFELLTGTSPFADLRLHMLDLHDLQRVVREQPPPRPSTALVMSDEHAAQSRDTVRLIRGDLDCIVLKALEKDREHRYQTVAQLADDVRRHMNHEPVLAGPSTATYRLRKFMARHRGKVATAAAMLTLRIAGIAGTTRGMVEARTTAAEARIAYEQAHAVNEFLREVLTSVEPDMRGADIRLVEVLGSASGTASTRFANHPLQEADVRVMLGQVYTRLDVQGQAVDEYKRAVALFNAAAEPESRRRLFAEVQLARSLLNQNRSREALRAVDGLTARVQAAVGEGDPLAFDAARLTAAAQGQAGHHNEAEQQLRRLRERAAAINAGDSVHIALLDSTITVLIRRVGRDEIENQAIWSEIKQLATEMATRAARFQGEYSIQALRSRVLMADAMWRLGDAYGAAAICNAVLSVSEQRLGRCHSHRVLAMNVLSHCEEQTGDPAAAATLRLKCVDCVRSRHGRSLPFIAATADALPVLDSGGRWIEGEALARELTDMLLEFGGGHDDMLFEAQLYVARFVSLQKRIEDADRLFASLLARTHEPRRTEQSLARLHLFHGWNCLQADRIDEAELHLLLAAIERQGTCWAAPVETQLALVELFDARASFEGRRRAM